MTKINITSLIKNQMKNDPHLKHVILNVNLKNPTIPSKIFFSVIVTLLVSVIVTLLVLSFLSVMLLQQIQALQTQVRYIDFYNKSLTFRLFFSHTSKIADFPSLCLHISLCVTYNMFTT